MSEGGGGVVAKMRANRRRKQGSAQLSGENVIHSDAMWNSTPHGAFGSWSAVGLQKPMLAASYTNVLCMKLV